MRFGDQKVSVLASVHGLVWVCECASLWQKLMNESPGSVLRVTLGNRSERERESESLQQNAMNYAWTKPSRTEPRPNRAGLAGLRHASSANRLAASPTSALAMPYILAVGQTHTTLNYKLTNDDSWCETIGWVLAAQTALIGRLCWSPSPSPSATATSSSSCGCCCAASEYKWTTIWSCQSVEQSSSQAVIHSPIQRGRQAGSARQDQICQRVARGKQTRWRHTWMLPYGALRVRGSALLQSCGRSSALLYILYMHMQRHISLSLLLASLFAAAWSAQMCGESYGDKTRRWQLLQTFLIKLQVGTLMRCRKCCCHLG